MITKLSLLISFILFLSFLENQFKYFWVKDRRILFLLRTKIHFIFIGFLLSAFVFREGLFPFFRDISYTIVTLLGFTFGFQLREKFIKRFVFSSILGTLLKSALILVVIYFLAFLLTGDSVLAAFTAVAFGSVSYFLIFITKNRFIPDYIFNLLTTFLFIFAVENLNSSILDIAITLLIIFGFSFLFFFLAGRRKNVELYIVVIAVILLVSGFTKQLGLAGLSISFFIGMIATNMEFPSKKAIENTLIEMETPLFAFLLFSLGLVITMPDPLMLGFFFGMWILGIFLGKLIHIDLRNHIPVSQISILFLTGSIMEISRPVITSFLITYTISNIAVLGVKRND